MSRIYVADTMAIVLFLEKRKLPEDIKSIFNSAVQSKFNIHFSAVSLMEIGYLSERKRIDVTIDEVLSFIAINDSFSLINLDAQVIRTAFSIIDIPELHDRLIAATALSLGAILITNDPLIQRSKHIETKW